jgi:hypothetical protein
MLDREQQLDRALSLIVMANQAVTVLRRKHGNKAAEETRRAAVREFNLAIEEAGELLAQPRTEGARVVRSCQATGPNCPHVCVCPPGVAQCGNTPYDEGPFGIAGWEHQCAKRPPDAPRTVLPLGEQCDRCGATDGVPPIDRSQA